MSLMADRESWNACSLGPGFPMLQAHGEEWECLPTHSPNLGPNPTPIQRGVSTPHRREEDGGGGGAELELIAIYNRRLDERDQRRAFILDRGLLNVKRLRRLEGEEGGCDCLRIRHPILESVWV